MKGSTKYSDAAAVAAQPRGLVVWALLCAGLVLWAILPRPVEMPRSPWWRWAVVGVAVGAALVPAVNRWMAARLERVRAPTARGRAMTGVIVSVVVAAYLLLTAFEQNRDLFPKTYDEASYTIQARQFAKGRLAYPQHELADFFDAPNLLVRPVYASAYFPGAALIFVPGVWLGLSSFVIPLIVSAACSGLLYRVIAEWVDGVAGLLAVVLLVGANVFRMLSVMPMSQTPVLLLGLLLLWAYLRYRARPRWEWGLVMGVLAGWALVTRPLDALCFIVPVVGGVVWIHFRKGDPAPRGMMMRAVLAAVVGALPFLAFQLALNHRVTGSALRSPFSLYIDADQPQTAFGFHRFDPDRQPRSVVAQKRALYADWVVPYVRRHQAGEVVRSWGTQYLPLMVDAILPARVLLILLPVGLLAVRRRWVVFLALPIFLGLYFFYAFFLEHYALTVTPAVSLVIVLAVLVLERAWPWIGPAVAVGVVALAVTSLYEFTRVSDDSFPSPVLRTLNDRLADLVSGERAIVLFRFHPGVNNPQEEPVFNTDVAWPDDAVMIRAHDLGERNGELFAYYARRAPGRVVYLYDRKPTPEDPLGTLTRLGRVSDLAKSSAVP
jgi:hypothetical protein